MELLYFIDDDDAAHTYHKLMAEEAGFDSTCLISFYNVDSAITDLKDRMEKNDPDWPIYVFIDLNMPIKSGFDFVDEIKEIVPSEKMPFIYLVSSSKNPMDVDRAREYNIIKGFETKFLEIDFFESIKENVKQKDCA